MRPYSVIIPINSQVYNADLLGQLTNIYTTSNIYVCVMGNNNNNVVKLLDQKSIDVLETITSIDFNYSYCVNYMVRKLLESGHDKKEIIAISDHHIGYSMLQLSYEKILKQEMLENSFITVDVCKDDSSSPIDLSNTKINLTITNRIKKLKDTSEKTFPVIVTTLECIDKLNGLDESMFTDVSRKQFIERMINYSYSEIKSQRVTALFINQDDVYPDYLIEKDLASLNSNRELLTKFVIPNNVNESYGDPSKIKRLVLLDNTPIWKDLGLYKTIPVSKDPSNTIKVFTDNNIPVEEQNKTLYDTPVLVLINNDIQDLISATPLLRKLYLTHGPVDVLLTHKRHAVYEILGNIYVKNIYEQDDVHASKIKISDYKTIISTNGCNVKLSPKIQIREASNNYDTLIENNFRSIDGTFNECIPFAFFKNVRYTIPCNTVTIASTLKPFRPDNLFTELSLRIDSISRRVVDLGYNVLFLSVYGEKIYGNVRPLLDKKNVYSFSDLKMAEYAALINQSSVVITTEKTDLFWLSYAIKKPTLVVKEFDPEQDLKCLIPKSDWIQYCKHNDPDLTNKVIKYIAEKV